MKTQEKSPYTLTSDPGNTRGPKIRKRKRIIKSFLVSRWKEPHEVIILKPGNLL